MIILFFYYGGIVQGVVFEGLLNNGIVFVNCFWEVFIDIEELLLAYIVIDGESYGYYYWYGEMVLVVCLCFIEE